jgi:hypothetical protein
MTPGDRLFVRRAKIFLQFERGGLGRLRRFLRFKLLAAQLAEALPAHRVAINHQGIGLTMAALSRGLFGFLLGSRLGAQQFRQPAGSGQPLLGGFGHCLLRHPGDVGGGFR